MRHIHFNWSKVKLIVLSTITNTFYTFLIWLFFSHKPQIFPEHCKNKRTGCVRGLTRTYPNKASADRHGIKVPADDVNHTTTVFATETQYDTTVAEWNRKHCTGVNYHSDRHNLFILSLVYPGFQYGEGVK